MALRVRYSPVHGFYYHWLDWYVLPDRMKTIWVGPFATLLEAWRSHCGTQT